MWTRKQQQQEKNQQQEERSCELVRPPLATKTLGAQKAHFENGPCSFGDNKFPFRLTHKDEDATTDNLTEKENNTDMTEKLRLPKRTGRASPRRNSLILLPSLLKTAKLHPPFLPLRTIQSDEDEVEKKESLPEQTPYDSPKQHRNANKKLSSAPRRSLQKKNHTKSSMQPHVERWDGKVRVSIGGRGRTGHILLGMTRRTATKDAQQKQSQRKEKRMKYWNCGKNSLMDRSVAFMKQTLWEKRILFGR